MHYRREQRCPAPRSRREFHSRGQEQRPVRAGELQARVAETTRVEEKASAAQVSRRAARGGAVQSCRGRLWGQKRRWYLTRTTCSRTSTRVRQRQEGGKCETIVKRGIRRNVLDPEGKSCCAATHFALRRPEERILVPRSGPPENFSLTMCVEVLPDLLDLASPD